MFSEKSNITPAAFIVPIGGRRPLAYVGRLPCAHPQLSARHMLQDLIGEGREEWPKRSMYLAAIRLFPAVRRPPPAPVLHPPRITLLISQSSLPRTRQSSPSPPVKNQPDGREKSPYLCKPPAATASGLVMIKNSTIMLKSMTEGFFTS